MDKKLILRAAVKYRRWMILQKEKTPCDHSTAILQQVNSALDKTSEIRAWAKRFLEVTQQQFQYNDWETDVRHDGIWNRQIHDNIATIMIPDIASDAIGNIRTATNLLQSMAGDGPMIPISLQEAITEIEIIDDGWPDVRFRDNRLSVVIANVVLSDGNEEVDFGDFRVFLNLTNPMAGLIVEPEGNGIISESGFCHPHVNDGSLCVGEGRDGICNALCQGRLEDYFRIVAAILNTYNDVSPYKELNDWYAPSHDDEFMCSGCEEWRPDDEVLYCEGCQECYCTHCDCDGGCCNNCGEWRCGECSGECCSCSEKVCDRCKTVCGSCNDSLCQGSECSVCCAICNIGYCEECTKSCANCGDTTCNDCLTNCEQCDDEICTNCAGNSCEHCGTKTCGCCEDEHNCLLATLD